MAQQKDRLVFQHFPIPSPPTSAFIPRGLWLEYQNNWPGMSSDIIGWTAEETFFGGHSFESDGKIRRAT